MNELQLPAAPRSRRGRSPIRVGGGHKSFAGDRSWTVPVGVRERGGAE